MALAAGGEVAEEAHRVQRFLGNLSTGRQGYALASVAAARGARVTLVAAHTELPDPAGVDLVRVGTAEEMRGAVLAAAADADAVVMAAAVADFRPADYVPVKIKKVGEVGPEPLALVRNRDILAEISKDRATPGQVVVGFAAETNNVLVNGRTKLARKGCDLLVVNQVGGGRAFGSADNEAVILADDGSETEVPFGPKTALADVLWDLVSARLAGHTG